MKLYQDKFKIGDRHFSYHGRYKNRYVVVAYSEHEYKWYFVVYSDDGYNSLWGEMTYNTKEEAAKGAVEWIDRSEGK